MRTAADAEEALALLESFRPRLILMNLQLPGMDGLELTRRLKADLRSRDIVILAFTAYAMKGDEEKARAAGCDGYVSKPVDTEALPRLVVQQPRPAGDPERLKKAPSRAGSSCCCSTSTTRSWNWTSTTRNSNCWRTTSNWMRNSSWTMSWNRKRN